MSLKPNQSDAEQILRKAADNNFLLFDTADLYDKGQNEELVGKALSPIRDTIKIATKVGNEWNNYGTDWRWNPSKEYILNAVNSSLRRLKTDYIDIYQLHGGTLEDPIDETIEAFELLKEQGKILSYGISSIRPNVIKEWLKRSSMSSVMMQYSLLDRRPEEECLDVLAKANINVFARGTVAKGMLINKPAKNYLGYTLDEVKLVQEAISKTQNRLSASIQFVNLQSTVKEAVLGIRTMSQLNDAIEAQSVKISESELLYLSELLDPNIYELHR